MCKRSVTKRLCYSTFMIEVKNISKTFGKFKAVDNLSFEVTAGEVYGLLGPNGAGKTTTLRILATLIDASSGSASVNGLDTKTHSEQVRKSIGVVNGGMGLYERLTGLETLQYFGKLYGMSKAEVKARVSVLDDLLDLGDTLTRRSGGFSTGMAQKIVIARAVLHDPPIIFFDEATSGLDVMARRAVLDFVRSYRSAGRAVIYSTHIMNEIEELCDRVGIIYKGHKIAEDSVAKLIAQSDAKNLEQAFFAIVEASNVEASNIGTSNLGAAA